MSFDARDEACFLVKYLENFLSKGYDQMHEVENLKALINDIEQSLSSFENILISLKQEE